MNKLVLCESRYDFKYQSIFRQIPEIIIVEGGFVYLLKRLFASKSIYHIRYIKYKNLHTSLIRIFLVYLVSKVSMSKIVWSCHNIYEHNIPSRVYNDFLRIVLSLVSSNIIVFHKDIIRYLPSFSHKKIKVACFGDYRIFIENQNEPNPDFRQKYNKWLDLRKIKHPELISISAAKRNKIHTFLSQLISSSINCLIIAPGQKPSNLDLSNNIFLYNNGFVRKEISEILNGDKMLIGLIGHNNISVPTSLYMFASYGIPIIGLDIEPINSIIEEYLIGEVLKDGSNLEAITILIKSRYKYYQKNCEVFLNQNSWVHSSAIHSKIFK